MEFLLILVLICINIGFNAFFVASEMALARIRMTRIDQLVEEGNKKAITVKKAISDPDRFISACQLGITFATLALGWFGEKFFAQHLTDFVIQSGLPYSYQPHIHHVMIFVCFIVSFTLTAFMQTIFGELIPKTLTFQRAELVMMQIIWPMEIWCKLTSPLLKILNTITAFVLHLFNVKEPPSHHFVHSEEELKMLVSASQEEGVLEEEEEEMLHSVFEFSDTQVSEVMTPRTDMVCISATATVKGFVDLALKNRHSRLPVFEEDMDSIFGAAHIRDGLKAIVEHKESLKVRELVHKVLIVPENKPVGDLLTEFKKAKTHMAIVVDEYGGTRGLVTIEDLLEELVGDIEDEHDLEEVLISKQADGSFILDGKTQLDEVNEELNLEIEDPEFNTIGGHVFGLLGREPKSGDEVESHDCILRIEEADRHRIIKLRLTKKKASAKTKTSGEGEDAISLEAHK